MKKLKKIEKAERLIQNLLDLQVLGVLPDPKSIKKIGKRLGVKLVLNVSSYKGGKSI